MQPYSLTIDKTENGKITEKTEIVGGKPVRWSYEYDPEGRLTQAWMDDMTICKCMYDSQGRRQTAYFTQRDTHGTMNYTYTAGNRLRHAGNNGYLHDDNGFRNLWGCAGVYTHYKYAPDYRLLRAEVEGQNRVFEFSHDKNGQRSEKYLNHELVEAYKWHDLVRMAEYFDGDHVYEFAYEQGERTPYALRRDDGGVAYLFYDQVSSLRVVADTSGNVIKEILYDPFGEILKDTNPSLHVPIGFAGGLHDRDLGFVRFGWRDYDPFTSRWTAPDPIGDAGGDSDWYGYCLDDPVNMVDPLGLMGSKPDEPNQSEPYFANSWQWQTNHGACEKCQALDGTMIHGDLSAAPEKPHPNCKCEIVECEYNSKFGDWETIERQVIEYKILAVVTVGAKATLRWQRVTRIKEKRERFMFRQCGSRLPDYLGKGKFDTRVRYEKDERNGSAAGSYNGRNPTQPDEVSGHNPWTGEWVSIPRPPGP